MSWDPGRQCNGSPANAAASDRMSSTPSGVSRCSRRPVDSRFAPSGRSSYFCQISRPSARTKSLPSGGHVSISLGSLNSPSCAAGVPHAEIHTTSSPPSGVLGVAPAGGTPTKPTLVPASTTAGVVAPAGGVVTGCSVTGECSVTGPVSTGNGPGSAASDAPPDSSSSRAASTSPPTMTATVAAAAAAASQRWRLVGGSVGVGSVST